MDLSSIDLWLMVLSSSVICLCLPKVVALLGSTTARKSLDFNSKERESIQLSYIATPSRPEFS